MAKTEYVYNINTIGHRCFTMPDGFTSTVEMHVWGAGGGNGYGQARNTGGGGGYVKSIEQFNPGDIIEVGVGMPGAPASINQPGAGGGSGIGIQYAGGPGALGLDSDGDNDGPYAGGGGGGATGVLCNGIPVAIAGGGGGSNGLKDDYIANGVGMPGGIQSITPNLNYYWKPTRWWGWNWWFNQYAVWRYYSLNSQSYSKSINFPVSGVYTIYSGTDRYISWTIDSQTKFTVVNSGSGYQTDTVTLTAGYHTLSIVTGAYAMYGDMSGGFGFQIFKPDGTLLWTTRQDNDSDLLTSNTVGGDGGLYSGGGGGGGFKGGLGGNGTAYGYDGGIRGGSGGLNFGDYIYSGSTWQPGGVGTKYFPSGGGYGYAGYSGYVSLVFQRKFRAYFKRDIYTENTTPGHESLPGEEATELVSTWARLNDAWVKQANTWKEVQNIYVKENNVWAPVVSTEVVPADRSVKYIVAGTYSWTCPPNVHKVKLMVYGGGGSGTGGAGGAGGCAVKLHTTIPGTIYQVIVGPGGVNHSWYQAAKDPAWSSFMQTYAIWSGGAQSLLTNTLSDNIIFPVSGTYTITYSGDNASSWNLDGGTTYTGAAGLYTSSTTVSVSVSAGLHTLNASVTNTGGPAGFAMTIVCPDSTNLWDTISYATGLTGIGRGGDSSFGGNVVIAGGGGVGIPFGATDSSAIVNVNSTIAFVLGNCAEIKPYSQYTGMSAPPLLISTNVLTFGPKANSPSPETRTATSSTLIDLRSETTLSYYINKAGSGSWGDPPDQSHNEPLTLEWSYDGSTWTTIDTVQPNAVSENVWTKRTIAYPFSSLIADVYLRYRQTRIGLTDSIRDCWAMTSIFGNQQHAGGEGGVATGGDINYDGKDGGAGRVVYRYWYWWWGWGGYWNWQGYYYYNYWNYGYYNYYWGYGYYGWGWPWYYRSTGYEYGIPGTGYDGIGSGAVGPANPPGNVKGGQGAALIIY